MTHQESTHQASYVNLTVGDPAPWFDGTYVNGNEGGLASGAGRYVVLGFFGEATIAQGRAALETVRECRAFFDDQKALFFGITWSKADQDQKLLSQDPPGVRYFVDPEAAIYRQFGILPSELDLEIAKKYPRFRWFVLDPQLRIIGIFPFQPNGAEREGLRKFLSGLPPQDRFAGFEMPVPIMAIPYVLEPELCRRMIALYEEHGGIKTGIMRDINGRSVNVLHDDVKRRADHHIQDPNVLQMLQDRLARRVFPEIEKVHFMKCTRSERYIIGCYDSSEQGFFRPHRDNVAKGNRHRRFAVSINLNSDFEGGQLNFPEYGSRWFKFPPGTAVVFSTPLLHQVSRVTKGRRYAFLPFVYDEAAAKVREEMTKFVGDGQGGYRAETQE